MCEIDFDGSTANSTASETFRKARKGHRCSSCRGPIRPGDRYLRHVALGDGTASTEKMCSACADARAEFGKEHGFEWCTPSYFPYLLDGCIDPRDEESVKKWQPMLDALRARKPVTP